MPTTSARNAVYHHSDLMRPLSPVQLEVPTDSLDHAHSDKSSTSLAADLRLKLKRTVRSLESLNNPTAQLFFASLKFTSTKEMKPNQKTYGSSSRSAH